MMGPTHSSATESQGQGGPPGANYYAWLSATLTAPASPWQNGFAERLIGSIRRECVDHFIVLGEAHLRRLLRAYARYYNDIRTHRSLDKGHLE